MSFHHEGPIPHFFKITLADGCLRYGKLRIPRSFIEKYGERLSNSNLAFLKLPCGAEWKIQVTESSDGEVWLQNGWQDFVNFYSLDHGHLLLFRYEGNSYFNVIIFDTSATEIEYPIPGTYGEEGKLDEEFQIPNTQVIEISGDFPSAKTASIPPPKGKLNKSSEKVTERASSSRALEAANEFTSENPFFMVTIGSAYPSHGTVSIPISFTKKCIKRSGQIVMLQVGDKMWPVKMLMYPNTNSSLLSAGWTAFFKENTLHEGDVCVFELIKRDNVVLKLSIFRSTPGLTGC